MRHLFVLILLMGASAEDEAARVHFLSGQAYYDQANYEDALREFGEAYRISKKPALLYNLAVCHEHLEHFGEAVHALEEYLAVTPEAPDRLNIETRIKNLKERERQKIAPPLLELKKDAPRPLPPTAPAPRRRVATWVVGGLGLGLLLGAVVSGSVAEVRFNSLKNDCGNGFACPSSVDLATRQAQGHNAAIATDVLWPIGTAAVATAVILFFVEGKKRP